MGSRSTLALSMTSLPTPRLSVPAFLARAQAQDAQALYARELGAMMAANLDHGGPPPDDPDASPVEARLRRFG